MKGIGNFTWLLGAIVAIVVCGQFLARGQQPSEVAPVNVGSLAIIDISLIFKESQIFRQGLESMKSDVDDAEKQLREERDVIKQLSQDLAAAEDPIVKNRLQAHVDEKSALLQAKVLQQKQDFMQRESKLYARTYREIERHIQNYAEDHDIRLVLRFNRIGIPEDDDRDKTLAAVNRAVIYQRDLDITDEILKVVNTARHDK